jgi:hypothetical protein
MKLTIGIVFLAITPPSDARIFSCLPEDHDWNDMVVGIEVIEITESPPHRFDFEQFGIRSHDATVGFNKITDTRNGFERRCTSMQSTRCIIVNAKNFEINERHVWLCRDHGQLAIPPSS